MTSQAEEALKGYSKTVGNDVYQVIKAIDDARAELNPIVKASPERLSQALVKLAALNSFLGEHVAGAEYDANTKDANYRHTREQIKLKAMNEDKTTASEAESIKIVDSQELLEAYNMSVYVHKLLANKRKDTSEFIDALRSRLSFVKTDMKESQNV